MKNTSARKKKILIVEDEEVVCDICRRVIDNGEFESETAHDGRTAETMVSVTDYALILLDIRLPVKSGIDFFNWLRLEYPDLSKRVIFMTGSTMESKITLFLKDSGQPYILKPFRPDELLSAVTALITTINSN